MYIFTSSHLYAPALHHTQYEDSANLTQYLEGSWVSPDSQGLTYSSAYRETLTPYKDTLDRVLTGCRCNQGEGGGLGAATYYDKNNSSSTCKIINVLIKINVLVVLYALELLFIAISLLSLSLTVSTPHSN